MDSRLIKPKAALLKDYLLDDVSSCSSNGFKSFPRRQCCTSTVRFLLEIELKQQQNQQQKYWEIDRALTPTILKLPSKSALAAFKTVVSAVKRLPAASPENARVKNSIRNLSSKILKKTRFWKRKSTRKEIQVQRWKSFDQLLKEDPLPSEPAASDFAVTDDQWSGNSSEINLNSPPTVKNDRVGTPLNGVVSADSISSRDSGDSANTKDEKQQFSPVSVLDCPFADDDEEVSSPFTHAPTNGQGTKKEHKKKIHKFEPVSLDKKFMLVQETVEKEPTGHSSSFSTNIRQEDAQQNQAEQKALDLLDQLKDTLPSYGIKVKADKLLVDFFQEQIIERFRKPQEGYVLDEELLDAAEGWINNWRAPGRELVLEWEFGRNRGNYIKDMEKGGDWKSLDQETEEVGLVLEGEVLGALLSELVVDISSMHVNNVV